DQGHLHREVACLQQISIGRLPEAEEHFRASLELFVQLHAEFPNNTIYWHFLADTHRRIGRILGAAHKPQEAEQAYRQAIEIHEQRAAQLPDTPGFRAEWSLAYSDLASQLIANGRSETAEE